MHVRVRCAETGRDTNLEVVWARNNCILRSIQEVTATKEKQGSPEMTARQ